MDPNKGTEQGLKQELIKCERDTWTIPPRTAPNVLEIAARAWLQSEFFFQSGGKGSKAGKWRGQWEGFCIMGQKCEKMKGH